MHEYETRITQLTVAPHGAPIFSEMSTTVTIDDEAAGEFVVVEQSARDAPGKIALGPDEWPVLREAIDKMIKECRENKDAP